MQNEKKKMFKFFLSTCIIQRESCTQTIQKSKSTVKNRIIDNIRIKSHILNQSVKHVIQLKLSGI